MEKKVGHIARRNDWIEKIILSTTPSVVNKMNSRLNQRSDTLLYSKKVRREYSMLKWIYKTIEIEKKKLKNIYINSYITFLTQKK